MVLWKLIIVVLLGLIIVVWILFGMFKALETDKLHEQERKNKEYQELENTEYNYGHNVDHYKNRDSDEQ